MAAKFSPAARLVEVNDLIDAVEEQLDLLYAERERLMWGLGEGDHSES